MSGYRQGAEDQRQHGEDEGLNGADEELQPVEGQRQQQWYQEGHHEQQDLSRQHVAEETKAEADKARDLGD